MRQIYEDDAPYCAECGEAFNDYGADAGGVKSPTGFYYPICDVCDKVWQDDMDANRERKLSVLYCTECGAYGCVQGVNQMIFQTISFRCERCAIKE